MMRHIHFRGQQQALDHGGKGDAEKDGSGGDIPGPPGELVALQADPIHVGRGWRS